jgi:hypothetical protein
MDLAHKLSSQLRAAEERASELEAEAAHFCDRAVRAEEWLQRIHNEVEQAFFQKKDRFRPRKRNSSIAVEGAARQSSRRRNGWPTGPAVGSD